MDPILKPNHKPPTDEIDQCWRELGLDPNAILPRKIEALIVLAVLGEIRRDLEHANKTLEKFRAKAAQTVLVR